MKKRSMRLWTGLTEDYPETSPEEENREYADYEDASVPEEEDEEGAYSGGRAG